MIESSSLSRRQGFGILFLGGHPQIMYVEIPETLSLRAFVQTSESLSDFESLKKIYTIYCWSRYNLKLDISDVLSQKEGIIPQVFKAFEGTKKTSEI